MSQLTSSHSHTPPWYLGATTLVTQPWLVRLRLVTIAVQAGVVVASLVFAEADFPLVHVAPLLLVAIALNALVARRASRRQPPVPALVAADAFVQILLLTELLELTGGPFNPFVVIYAVQAVVVWLTAGALWGGLTGAAALVSFGFLVYWHLTELVPGHHRLNDFPTHLLIMWMSIVTTAELAAYFVSQASNAVARREEELEAMRRRAARDERLVSLTTLAAGAAHELSTPLATIALASKELERAAAGAASAGDLLGDARLIREQVDRCQVILDQMSGRAGGVTVDQPEAVDVSALLADVRSSLAPRLADRVRLDLPERGATVHVPRAGLRQAVVSLLTNALDASGDTGAPVIVGVERDGAQLRVQVRDAGPGMSAAVLQRAGEPFFTTKEAGRGRGLGLFLARVFAERCGGSLALQSDRGTTAVLELPIGPTAV